MTHPYFDAVSFPWHRTDANRLHDVLVQLIPQPQAIDAAYQRSAPDLPALTLSASPGLIWREALNNLSHANALRPLLEWLRIEYPRNMAAMIAVGMVMEASITGYAAAMPGFRRV